MNFTLKLQEYFIDTLIQITVKDENYLLTFTFFDPPYEPIQKRKLFKMWKYYVKVHDDKLYVIFR